MVATHGCQSLRDEGYRQQAARTDGDKVADAAAADAAAAAVAPVD